MSSAAAAPRKPAHSATRLRRRTRAAGGAWRARPERRSPGQQHGSPLSKGGARSRSSQARAAQTSTAWRSTHQGLAARQPLAAHARAAVLARVTRSGQCLRHTSRTARAASAQQAACIVTHAAKPRQQSRSAVELWPSQAGRTQSTRALQDGDGQARQHPRGRLRKLLLHLWVRAAAPLRAKAPRGLTARSFAQLPVPPEGDAGGPSAHAGVLRRGVQQQSLLRGQGAWLLRERMRSRPRQPPDATARVARWFWTWAPAAASCPSGRRRRARARCTPLRCGRATSAGVSCLRRARPAPRIGTQTAQCGARRTLSPALCVCIGRRRRHPSLCAAGRAAAIQPPARRRTRPAAFPASLPAHRPFARACTLRRPLTRVDAPPPRAGDAHGDARSHADCGQRPGRQDRGLPVRCGGAAAAGEGGHHHLRVDGVRRPCALPRRLRAARVVPLARLDAAR